MCHLFVVAVVVAAAAVEGTQAAPKVLSSPFFTCERAPCSASQYVHVGSAARTFSHAVCRRTLYREDRRAPPRTLANTRPALSVWVWAWVCGVGLSLSCWCDRSVSSDCAPWPSSRPDALCGRTRVRPASPCRFTFTVEGWIPGVSTASLFVRQTGDLGGADQYSKLQLLDAWDGSSANGRRQFARDCLMSEAQLQTATKGQTALARALAVLQ